MRFRSAFHRSREALDAADQIEIDRTEDDDPSATAIFVDHALDQQNVAVGPQVGG